MFKKLITLSLFLLSVYSLGYAGVTGKIMGTVHDKNTGDAIIGANIYLEGSSFGAATDVNGNYYIINISPGSYNLICSYIGYERTKVTNVHVSIDRSTTQNFLISPQVLEGNEVIVIGKREIIEKGRTNTAAYVSSDEIEAMPVQEVGDLIQLQAGVVQDAGGSFHIRGGRSGEIAYLIDGVPVTDQYNGGSTIGLENNWVQELQVISGTFNAEYGQAQSGVVNIVTKEGAKKFSGKVSLSFGDHLSSNEDIFWNIDDVGVNEKDMSISLQGPIKFLPEGSFYTSVRYKGTDGWLYGVNNVKIEDTVPIQHFIYNAQRNQTEDERLFGIEIPDSLQTGDGSYIPIDGNEKISFYGKIATRVFNSVKLKYSLFYDTNNGKSYSDYRRYSPEGVRTYYGANYNHILSLNHVLSTSTFYTLNFSNYSKHTQAYLFEDPLDSRYQNSPYAVNSFSFGGTQNDRYNIIRSAISAKLDFTSQVNRYNLVKVGGEIKRHHLDYTSSTTVADGALYKTPTLRVPDQNTAGNNHYVVEPMEASLYAQNKLEFEELIVNLGFRLDYWDPNALIPVDLRAETDTDDGIRLDSELEESVTRTQISPRFGLAYPISETGVVHVSYGHFFQLPRFNAIYNNYEYEIELGGLQTKMGNVNLKPEKTIGYEIGLQQQISSVFSIDLTLYYKDISNLLSQEIINTLDKKVYARYINRDYGNVKGFTVSLNKLHSNMFSGSIDYTYQVARGNASDPNAVFSDFQSNPPRESEKQVLPLDWDQTHTLNTSISVGKASDWNVGLIGRFSTGQPYTPSNPGSALTAQFENSDRKPISFNIDMNIYKFVKLNSFKVKLFCKVFNLTDRLNELYVYSSTGEAEFPYRTLPEREVLLQNPNFTLEEVDLRPDFYSEPRRVLLGMQLNF